MKRSIQIGLIAGCAVLGIGFWIQYPEKRVPAPIPAAREGETGRVLPGSLGFPPPPTLPLLPSYAPSSAGSGFDAAVLHSTLQRWRDARAADSEDELERLMKELLSLVTDQNVAQILQSLSKEELDTPFSQVALRRWMKLDPAAATQWAESRSDTPESPLAAVAAEEWANNKAGLLAYVQQLPDTRWKQNLLNAAGLELTSKDPHGAIDLAQKMKPGEEQTHLLQAVVCDWISREPTAALEWIIDVHEPALREQLTAAAAKSYALTEPNLAADWLLSTVRSPDIKNEAVLNIVETWSSTEPEKAAKWVTTALDGETRKTAVDIISSHWMNSDPVASKAWVQALSSNGK